MERKPAPRPQPADGPAPAPAPRDDVRVGASPTRCPYCHDGVDPEDVASLVCQRCLSRHHAECWEGRCASCQGEQALGVVARPPAPRRARWEARLLAGVNWTWLAVMIAYVLTGFLQAETLEDTGPFLVMLNLAAAMSIVSWVVTTRDALLHAEGLRPKALALLGVCSGGITCFVYFRKWGRGAPSSPGSSSPGSGSPGSGPLPGELGGADKDKGGAGASGGQG